MEFQILQIALLVSLTKLYFTSLRKLCKCFIQDGVEKLRIIEWSNCHETEHRENAAHGELFDPPRSVPRVIRRDECWKVKNPRGKSEDSLSSLASVTEVRYQAEEPESSGRLGLWREVNDTARARPGSKELVGRTPELRKGGNRVKLQEKQEEPAVLLANRKRSHEAAINTLRHLHLTSTYVPTRQKRTGCASLHETPTCLAYSAQFLRELTCETM